MRPKLKLECSDTLVRGDLCRHSLTCYKTLKAIKFWFRILNMNERRLAVLCSKPQFRWEVNGQECWAFYVCTVLFSYDFGHVWINQGVGNEAFSLLTTGPNIGPIPNARYVFKFPKQIPIHVFNDIYI